MNAFGNSRRVNNVDVPVFVRPDTASGLPLGGGGMAIRQTTLGLALSDSDVLGASFSGSLDVDFFGGQQPSAGGRTFPLVRMRIARAALSWRNAELMMGQDAPLVLPQLKCDSYALHSLEQGGVHDPREAPVHG